MNEQTQREDGTDVVPFINEEVDSVSSTTLEYFKLHAASTILWVGLAVAVEVFAIIVRVQYFAVYFLPIVFLYTWWLSILKKIEDEFMQQFAKANGYAYSEIGMYGHGHLFSLGHTQQATDRVIGQYNGYPIEVYLYSYVTGEGKGRQEHRYTVFTLNFDTQMPDVVMTNKHQALDTILAPSGAEAVNLEGDFNDYFTLHVPKGYEIEALEVFTPDVMQALIEKGKQFNMEIYNNFLYIYKPSYVSNKKDLYAMYELARYMTDKLAPVLAAMKPSLISEQEEKEEAFNS